MHDLKAACIYQETRLNLDPALPASTVEVLLPIDGASAFASRLSPKRRRIDRSSLVYDEATFSSHHLASESSIYLRPLINESKKSPSPRAILWRILEDRKVLELQAIDLSQEQTEKHEPLLTLRLAFPHAIRPAGVDFAEKERGANEDGFVGFVLTMTGEIVTLNLRKDLFVRAREQEDQTLEASAWCKTYSPSAFSYRTPHRFLAKSESEVWASLNDGSLLKLERQDDTDGSSWIESSYTEGGWKASMRGLIPWKAQATVRHQDVDLSPQTAASIVPSPDGKHIWAAYLDHTLKAWNIESGKITFAADLAGDTTRDLQKPVASLLDPARTHLIKVAPALVSREYIVITFSPKTREFKFWAVKDADSDDFGVQDIRPDVKLIPPMDGLTDAAMWTVESFDLRHPHDSREHEWELWTLLRFGVKCQAFSVKFNLDDHTEGLSRDWQNNWSCVDPGLNTVERLRQNLQNPGDSTVISNKSSASSTTEQWLDFFFYPGRFTTATLETALSIYWKSLSRIQQSKKQSLIHPSRALKDRICETLNLCTGLLRGADDCVAYDRFEHDVASQWQIFYGVVKDLHKRREDLLALVFDNDLDIPWLVMADQISAVRDCSECEFLWLNREIFAEPESIATHSSLLQALSDTKNAELGQFFNAIAVFRGAFSRHFLQSLQALIRTGGVLDFDKPPSDLLVSIYDLSDFAGQVSDEDYNRLTYALEPLGGLANIDNSVFAAAMELLGEKQHGQHEKRQLTRYGSRALIRGAQETLEMGSDILFNMLLLVIFMAAELEEGDLSADFDASVVFTSLMERADEFNLLSWLATTVRQEVAIPSATSETPEDSVGAISIPTLDEAHAQTSPRMTILESIFVGDWAGMLFPAGPQSNLLTYWCRAWAFGARLSQQYESITSHIMGVLLKDRDIALAYEFLKFLPENPWCLYLRGRLYMATGEFAEAGLWFEQAAPDLASGRYFDIEQFDSANLVDLVERNLFNEGLPPFYQHVASLFERAGNMSYVAHFASLGLEAIEHVDDDTAAIRSELLSRVFTASLQTSRLSNACSALTQYTDLALQRSALHSLLKTLLSTSQIPLLLSLSLPVPEEVDAYLSSLASHETSQPFTSILAPVSESKSPQYYKVLYAYRLARGNLRAAASCYWDRLQLLRAVRDHAGGQGINENTEQEIMEAYLTLINVLSLMDAEQAWMLTRPLAKNAIASVAPPKFKIGQALNGSAKSGDGKRKVVTLADVRKEWQEELDRRADFRAGRVPLLFGFGAGAEANGAAHGQEGMDMDVFA